MRLYLNLSRVEYRDSNKYGRGVSAAHSSADLEFEWADALAETKEEAEHILFEANSGRQDARDRAKVGFPGA